MADIDRLIGFMAIMQVPFMNDPDALMYIEEVKAALKTLKAQEPRVMTLEEVVAHYSLPPVFPDDLGMQFDYLNDIQPLYFDFPLPEDPWIVHWRKYDEVDKYLDGWKTDYGKTWRCWTSRPSDEQREAVPWNGCGDSCPIERSDAD